MQKRSSSKPATFIVSRPSCDDTCAERSDACRFQVAWSINPHMRIGSVDGRLAAAQHDGFVGALRRAGAEVVHVPFVHGAFDSVFSKDNALLGSRDGRSEALLGCPRHAERRTEQKARERAYRDLGLSVRTARSSLEGGDIVVIPGTGEAFLGHGFRSDVFAAHELESFLDASVTALELCDERLYHLDMALTVLEDGTALVCLEAFTPVSRRALLNHPAVRRVIAIPLEEALAFGVNLVQVNRTIIWGATAPRTTRALVDLGYRVQRVPLSQFHLAGGSAACLVSRVHVLAIEESAPASRAA